jgi:hypothetical protein
MFFGQLQTVITLPKADKKYNYAVFGPQAGQKLHKTKVLVPSAGKSVSIMRNLADEDPIFHRHLLFTHNIKPSTEANVFG